MNPRTWLAISLACLVWFAYLKWFAPPPPTPIQPATTATQTLPIDPGTAPPTTGTVPAANAQDVLTLSSKLYKTNNADFEISFSPKGGRIAEVQISKYKTSIDKNAGQIKTISPEHSSFSLATLFSDPELSSLSNAEFKMEGAGRKVDMLATNTSGLAIQKQYEIPEAGYLLDSTVTIRVPQNAKRNWGTLSIPLGGKGLEYSHEVPLKSWETVYLQTDKVHRVTLDSLPEKEEVKQGTTSWVAFGNRYFATAVATQSEINPDVVLTKTSDFSGSYLRFPVVLKEGQTEVTYKFKVYSGPKIVTELSKVEGLKQLIDYGMFSVFAYPLLGILRFFYDFVHNYGIAIILLTLLVRILFYPLSIKSYQSMKAMQKLQPQIQALKAKYKDDMARMNQEQMALFKAHKVNPMGGCFPMLVQLPVFIALYAVLGNSIELFQAPFFGWVHDLSTKDPFYVYPILMGIAMFLQQKMTPAAGMDPAQQKIMLFMPVIFSFMMVGLPSGLTLYIFVSTLLGILQQWAMMRDPKEPTPSLAVAGSTPKSK